jgi:two-component system, NarL family, response regulator NreC
MPYRDILTPLMQRLVRLVGTSTALQLAHSIPRLEVEPDGTVLDYDHDDPAATAHLLMEHYELALAIAAALTPKATLNDGANVDMRDMPKLGTSSTPPIRILVVDDHALVREGLVSLIDPQPDMSVVGQAGTVREAISLAQRVRPEVILIDFTLPDGTGDQAAREILATLPETKVIFLTVHDDDARVFAAVGAGAVGYLVKSLRSADLLSQLRGVMAGETAFSPAIGRRILDEVARRPPRRAPAPAALVELTEREVAILRLIVKGQTNRQIAATLALSVRTVEHHRANITGKLGLQSRADLVRYAAAQGLLDHQNAKHASSPDRPAKL